MRVRAKILPASSVMPRTILTTPKAEEYVPVKLVQVGMVDEDGSEGMMVLASLSDRERQLVMRAFSGEVASHIDRFSKGDRSSLPTIYNIVEDMADRNGLHLVSVQIYGSNAALRGDISFEGRDKRIVLHGYRASDCVALAVLYDAPLLVQSTLLVREVPGS